MFAARAAVAASISCAAAVAPAATTVPTQAPETAPGPAIYVTREGDTLIAIADRALVRPQDWQAVARRNDVADPRRLPVGKTLVIPTALLRREPATALVAAFSGDVRRDTGGPLKVGTSVGAGTVLTTGANSFVSLSLADGSRVTLPSQSRVSIERLDRVVLDGRVERSFVVAKGRVDVGATPRERPVDRFFIKTPVAVAAVRGTEFRVAHDTVSGNSVVSVVEGEVASRSLARPDVVAVTAGSGAVLGAAPVKLARLLPPPQLDRPGRVQDDPDVAFTVAPVAGARLHVQLARDAGFVDRFAEAETEEPAVRFGGVGNGTLYVRVTAIDADGVEGLPADYAIERFRTGLEASAGALPGKPRRTLFRWQPSGEGSRRYDFVLARDELLTDRVIDTPGLTGTEMTVTSLAPGDWYWRVTMTVAAGGKTYERALPVRKLTIARRER